MTAHLKSDHAHLLKTTTWLEGQQVDDNQDAHFIKKRRVFVTWLALTRTELRFHKYWKPWRRVCQVVDTLSLLRVNKCTVIALYHGSDRLSSWNLGSLHHLHNQFWARSPPNWNEDFLNKVEAASGASTFSTERKADADVAFYRLSRPGIWDAKLDIYISVGLVILWPNKRGEAAFLDIKGICAIEAWRFAVGAVAVTGV